jgi:hypothetical protein
MKSVSGCDILIVAQSHVTEANSKQRANSAIGLSLLMQGDDASNGMPIRHQPSKDLIYSDLRFTMQFKLNDQISTEAQIQIF